MTNKNNIIEGVTDNLLSESDRGLSVTFDGFFYYKYCLFCKKKFDTPYPHQVYCSYSCNYRGTRLRKKSHKEKVECICLECNNKYMAKRKDTKFCSVKCRVANFRKNKT